MITDRKVDPNSSFFSRNTLRVPVQLGPSLTDRPLWIHNFGLSCKVAGVWLYAPPDGPTEHRFPVGYTVEDLAVNGDVTERACWRAPVGGRILDSVKAIQEAASAGIDGSNTAVITLRNITGAVDIATIALTADVVANAATALTLSAANADVAAGDVIGLVVTQGTTADLAAFNLWFEFSPNRVLGTLSVSGVVVPNGAGIITAPAFSVHSTPEQLAVTSFQALVGGHFVAKAAATAIAFSAAHVVAADKYGAVLVQMTNAGVLSTLVVGTQTGIQAYDSRAAALAALPAAASGQIAVAALVVKAEDAGGHGAWTAITDDLTDASDLETLEILNAAALEKFSTDQAFVAGKAFVAIASADNKAVLRPADYLVMLGTSAANGVYSEGTASLSVRPFPANQEVMTKLPVTQPWEV